jgi:hypothetical protein
MGNCCMKANNKTKKGYSNDIEMGRSGTNTELPDEHSPAT